MSSIIDTGRKLPKALRKQKVFTIYRHLDHPLRGLSKPPSAAGVYRKKNENLEFKRGNLFIFGLFFILLKPIIDCSVFFFLLFFKKRNILSFLASLFSKHIICSLFSNRYRIRLLFSNHKAPSRPSAVSK